MKPTKQHGNGNDPVALARAALNEATAKLAEHDQRKAALDQEAERLAGDLDQATLRGDARSSDHAARELAKAREQIHSLIRVRRHLVEAVAQAEAELQARQAQAAQTEIHRLTKEKSELNGQALVTLRALYDLLDQGRALQTQADALAEAHGLPAPGRGRLILDRLDIRRQAAEELQAILNPDRTYGLAVTPAP